MKVLIALVASIFAAGCAGAAALVVCGSLGRMHRPGRALTLEEALADRTLCFALLCAAGAVLCAAVSLAALPVCVLAAWALSRRMPALLERRRARLLASACDAELDVMADIIAMGVRAGLSFDAAVDIYCEKFGGALSHEMRRARLGWKNGMVSRERALRELAERVGSRSLARFAETSAQAIRYGSPLADMLNTLAIDLRRERREGIERQVAKAPVKMLVPTAACILPAMLIFVMGPAIVQFAQAGM